MRVSSKCRFSLLLGSMLALPAIGQQTNTSQQSTGGTQVVRTMDDLRERILLDRIEQLEKRLADLEARNASAPVAPSPAAATSAPAAQDPAPAAPAAQAPAATPEAAPPTWSVGPIDFNGLVDGYYSFNFNHPAGMSNQLYNFDIKANQFSLNMAKLTLAHSPDPVGFQVDLGFGRAFDIIHASEPSTAPSFLRNIEQAYVSLKPPKAKGFEVDFGQFVTSAGAEVIETNRIGTIPARFSSPGLFRITTSAYARRFRSANISPAACSSSMGGTTQRTTIAARPWGSPAPLQPRNLLGATTTTADQRTPIPIPAGAISTIQLSC